MGLTNIQLLGFAGILCALLSSYLLIKFIIFVWRTAQAIWKRNARRTSPSIAKPLKTRDKKAPVPEAAADSQKPSKKTPKPKAAPPKLGTAPTQQLGQCQTPLITLCASPCGRFVLVTSTDRTGSLFEFNPSGKTKFERLDFGDDYPSCSAFRADGLGFALAWEWNNSIKIYAIDPTRITQKSMGKCVQQVCAVPFTHKELLRSVMFLSPTQILSCDRGYTLEVHDLAGTKLLSHTLKCPPGTQLAWNTALGVLATTSFSCEVKLWKLKAEKTGALAFPAKHHTCMFGHNHSITAVSFSEDSLALTASKDNTWKIWNLNVRYDIDETPKVVFSGPIPDSTVPVTFIQASPSQSHILLGNHQSLHLYKWAAALQTASYVGHLVIALHSVATIAWMGEEHLLTGVDGVDRSASIWHLSKFKNL
eukprot:NODE_1816_length_1372_cov_61.490763_g1724_i0.p1 GENE.NODE_1816_length_1372_cov_61.490763_g1724_i0~~NODE_1816_length_1372_cov_61.490763_g1724_i0.p1  ORF type:complete len:438 (+),score=100.80 NODE_1816_length_1372_cov_61.490763_g1724_i0:52-1314(+)